MTKLNPTSEMGKTARAELKQVLCFGLWENACAIKAQRRNQNISVHCRNKSHITFILKVGGYVSELGSLMDH